MCFLAPATLIDPAIVWEGAGERSARAVFSNAGHTVHAKLTFNDADELIDFLSDDRFQIGGADGAARRCRWSTPLADYRRFEPARLASRGAAVWHEPSGDYPYIELMIDDVQYNVSHRRRDHAG
jgi:hypothetical protein